MKEIEPFYEFRNIQLQILLAFDSFCRANDIKYSLAYGTLIGVVRHKGFIPWDDDIDVFLTRPEYERLIALFPDSLNKKYKLACLERYDKWNRAYAKMYDTRTLIKESVKNNTGIGVGIDLFPIDEIPGDEKTYIPYLRKMGFLKSFYILKSLRVNPSRSLIKNMIIIFSIFVTWPFSYRSIALYISKLSQKYNGRKTGYLSDNVDGYSSTHPFLASDFEDYTEMSFENHHFMVMKGWHDVLTKIYGDYMILPPSEKQVSHHLFKAYWK